MTDKATETAAETLFLEGKRYDLLQDKSPAVATLARAAFTQAATMGHSGAIRALAHMIFDGRGGGQDREHALLLLWNAFLRRDHDALEELEDILESYAEVAKEPSTREAAADAARDIGELRRRLNGAESFIRSLAQERIRRTRPAES